MIPDKSSTHLESRGLWTRLAFVLLFSIFLCCVPKNTAAQDFSAVKIRLQTETKYDPDGPEVTNPEVGQSLYPHFYYDLSGAPPSSPVAVRLRRNDDDSYSDLTQTDFSSPRYVIYWGESSPWVVTAGEHTFVGTVDVNNSYAETDETNNSVSRTYNVSLTGETATPTSKPISTVTPTPTLEQSLALALFEFARHWLDGTHEFTELFALLEGTPLATPTPTSTEEIEPSTPTPTMTEGGATPTPTVDSGTFDFKDFFVETAGSNWHYTGADGASQDDDFRWTVLPAAYDVGGGKDAAQFKTDTDEPTDARNGDVDLWRVEPNGDVVFYGIIRASNQEYSGITIPAQPIVLPDPILVGGDGLSIGDEITESKSGSMDVIVPLLGTQTLTGTFNSSIKFTEFMPTFVTPMGVFTNVLRVVIDIEVTVNVPYVGSKDFEFTNSTFFFKEGVGMVGQDQDPDPDDAQKQVIDEGTVYVGGSPVPVVAN